MRAVARSASACARARAASTCAASCAGAADGAWADGAWAGGPWSPTPTARATSTGSRFGIWTYCSTVGAKPIGGTPSRAPTPPRGARALVLRWPHARARHRLRRAPDRAGALGPVRHARAALAHPGADGDTTTGSPGSWPPRSPALAAEEDGLAAVVVGLPRRLDGTPNDLTARVEAFADRLRARVGVPVVLQDERLTSAEAESRLARRERDWRTRKARIDAAAAAIILQDYLDQARPPVVDTPEAEA